MSGGALLLTWLTDSEEFQQYGAGLSTVGENGPEKQTNENNTHVSFSRGSVHCKGSVGFKGLACAGTVAAVADGGQDNQIQVQNQR